MPVLFPQTTQPAWYRMGYDYATGPDDFVFNYRLADGTSTAVQEPEGWEGVSYQTPLDQVAGRDGALVGPVSVGPMMLEINGAMVAPDPQTLRANIQRIRHLLGPKRLPGPRPPVVWEQWDFLTAQPLAVLARPTGQFTATPMVGGGRGGVATTFRFTLVASSPWRYSSGAASSANVGLPNPAVVTGRTYDKTFDWSYGLGTNPGGTMTVINSGDLDAYPLFQVDGHADYPVITNGTTGASFGLNADILSGQTVTADAATGAITPGNVRAVGRPFVLAPGPNLISWRTTSGNYYSDARLTVTWRSTFG
jgi:hypothetical protein